MEFVRLGELLPHRAHALTEFPDRRSNIGAFQVLHDILPEQHGIRVEFHGHENIAVKSLATLMAGLARPKVTFRQRICQFNLNNLPTGQLEQLEAKAVKLGDYVLGGHLLRDVDTVWDE